LVGEVSGDRVVDELKGLVALAGGRLLGATGLPVLFGIVLAALDYRKRLTAFADRSTACRQGRKVSGGGAAGSEPFILRSPVAAAVKQCRARDPTVLRIT
jgi:hypothetical protein